MSIVRNKEFVNQIRNNTNTRTFHRLNAISFKSSRKIDLSHIYMNRNKSKNYFIPRISAGTEKMIIKRTPHGSDIKYLKGGVRVKKLGGR